jgi:hypothetical protein
LPSALPSYSRRVYEERRRPSLIRQPPIAERWVDYAPPENKTYSAVLRFTLDFRAGMLFVELLPLPEYLKLESMSAIFLMKADFEMTFDEEYLAESIDRDLVYIYM